MWYYEKYFFIFLLQCSLLADLHAFRPIHQLFPSSYISRHDSSTDSGISMLKNYYHSAKYSHKFTYSSLQMALSSSVPPPPAPPTATINPAKLKPREFKNVFPVPCTGIQYQSNGDKLPTMFLAPENMVVQERASSTSISTTSSATSTITTKQEFIAKNVVPITIRADYEAPLLAAARAINHQQNNENTNNNSNNKNNNDNDNISDEEVEEDILKQFYYQSWSGQVITDRNNGFYDELSRILSIWHPETAAGMKKNIYEQLRNKKGGFTSFVSPYHGMVQALQQHTNVSIAGLLLEIADRQSDVSYSLGGAVLLVNNHHDHVHSNSSMSKSSSNKNNDNNNNNANTTTDGTKRSNIKWQLTERNFQALTCLKQFPQEAKLTTCTMDELIGFAFATNLPILMPTNVYESVAVDGLLVQQTEEEEIEEEEEKEEDEEEDDAYIDDEEEEDSISSKNKNSDQKKNKNTKSNVKQKSVSLIMTAPYFSSEMELQAWQREQARLDAVLQTQQQKAAKVVPKASEILNASQFLLLKTSEKRAILRATGVFPLPRPREGPRAVDALLIPLLDEEVAYEILRRLAETRGNYLLAAKMEDFESRKPFLARQIRLAQAQGDHRLARTLCEELNALSMLSFNPTNAEEAAAEWDVEEWYWEQRKRVYGIIAW